MLCNNCNKEIPEGIKFCPICGKAVEPNSLNSVYSNNQSPSVTLETKQHFSEDTIKKVGIYTFLIAIYVCVSILFLFIINANDTVVIKSLFDDDMQKGITLNELSNILIKGNRIFNPTIISTTLGVSIHILAYSIPVFAIMALIQTLTSKKSRSLHIVFSIFSCIGAITIAGIITLSQLFVPEFNRILSISTGVIFEDIKTISVLIPILFAIGIITLIVVSNVLLSMLKKGRSKNEQ